MCLSAFTIPPGFNGSFYVFILHLWLLHCRLMQSSKSKRSSFFSSPLLSSVSPPVAVSNRSTTFSIQQYLAARLPQKVVPVALEDVKEALTRQIYGRRLLQYASSPSCDMKQLSPGAHWEGGPLHEPGRETVAGIPEGLGLAMKISALRGEIAGEILNEYLFKHTWDILRDWLQLKKVLQREYIHNYQR